MRVIKSVTEPRNTNVIWIDISGDKQQTKIWSNNGWVSVGGSGSGEYDETIKKIIDGAPEDFDTLKELAEGLKNVPIEIGSGTNSARLKNAENISSAPYSRAFGYKAKASAQGAEAFGRVSVAASKYSHAEGYGSATGDGEVTALDGDVGAGYAAHAEGISTKASGAASHSEGREVTCLSDYSHSQGRSTLAGQKAYRYKAINTAAKRMSFDGFVPGFEVGDIVSIINDKKYPDCCTIATIVTQGDHNNITFNEAFPFTSLVDDDGFDAKLIYVSAKPGVGDVDLGMYAHSEGWGTKAQNTAAHAEGRDTQALGEYSHAEGRETVAQYAGHAEGLRTQATGVESHSEGMETMANNTASHAEGARTTASGPASHAEGADTVASGSRAHAEGNKSLAIGQNSHCEGNVTSSVGHQSHTEGMYNLATGDNSHVEGKGKKEEAKFYLDFDEDNVSLLSYNYSGDFVSHGLNVGDIIEVDDTYRSVIEIVSNKEFIINKGFGFSKSDIHPNVIRSRAQGMESHAEGLYSFASGDGSHSEGFNTIAYGQYSHAEGNATIAGQSYNTKGFCSHAEGRETKVFGTAAHVEGYLSIANGDYSHAEGYGCQTLNNGEHASGYANKSNKDTTFSHGIGKPASGIRKNAIEITKNGEIYIYGVAGYNGTNPQTGVNSLQKALETLGVTIDWDLL